MGLVRRMEFRLKRRTPSYELGIATQKLPGKPLLPCGTWKSRLRVAKQRIASPHGPLSRFMASSGIV